MIGKVEDPCARQRAKEEVLEEMSRTAPRLTLHRLLNSYYGIYGEHREHKVHLFELKECKKLLPLHAGSLISFKFDISIFNNKLLNENEQITNFSHTHTHEQKLTSLYSTLLQLRNFSTIITGSYVEKCANL